MIDDEGGNASDKRIGERYQDYVIREGCLIGDFETMYRRFDDPWEQLAGEVWAGDKALALNWLSWLHHQHHVERVIEVGCGLGAFTRRIGGCGITVLGTDVSVTAIEKARKIGTSQNVSFEIADILSVDVYDAFEPDAFVLSDITWYVLEELPKFKAYLREHYAGKFLIHLLTTYPPGRQSYGSEHFSTHYEIVDYFGFDQVEAAVFFGSDKDSNGKSAFLARIE